MDSTSAPNTTDLSNNTTVTIVSSVRGRPISSPIVAVTISAPSTTTPSVSSAVNISSPSTVTTSSVSPAVTALVTQTVSSPRMSPTPHASTSVTTTAHAALHAHTMSPPTDAESALSAHHIETPAFSPNDGKLTNFANIKNKSNLTYIQLNI